MNRDKSQGSMSSNAYFLTPAGIHFTGVPIFAGILASLEQQMRMLGQNVLFVLLFVLDRTYFSAGALFSKGIDNIAMGSTDRGMQLRSVQ
jgi:hypothetical protein